MKQYARALAGALFVFASCQIAAGQSNVPAPPIAKPVVLPKPVANRLIKRPQAKSEQTPTAGN